MASSLFNPGLAGADLLAARPLPGRARTRFAEPTQDDDENRWLKYGVWAYFLLLIFEGALRKWVLPGLSVPLLVIRDPIALWLLLLAWRRGLLPANLYLTGMVLVGAVGLVLAALVGHGSVPVALFGARLLIVHFPLMFAIGRIFNREDVVRLGKATLWLTIPMTVLIALQFFSPQSAKNLADSSHASVE